jgi:hypothetical protein
MQLPTMDFDDLARELNLWAGAGRAVRLWWRDDDAFEPTPALARLLDLSDAHRTEVSVAVVPVKAADTLPAAIAGRGNCAVLQHGYAHRNHAPAGMPAVECGGARPVSDVLEEMGAGRVRLEEMFGQRFAGVLAAPWNRIEPAVLGGLAEAGFRGASAAGPCAAMPGGGLVVANVHVDPINWRERRFAGLGKALSGLLGELRSRRTGTTDPDEPLGLLTHHLDHDEGLWNFLDELLAMTTRHPAARWITAAEAFALVPTHAGSEPRRA